VANTLTVLQPTIFKAARIVPRELVGLAAAVRRDFDDGGVAKGGTVTVPVMPVQTAASFSPAQTFTAGSDRTPTTRTVTLNQAQQSTFQLSAEDERQLMLGGSNAVEAFSQTLAQAWRVLINGVEAYLGTTLSAGASRAYGTATTAPFASDMSALAQGLKILKDNGVSGSEDLQAVIDTTASTNLRLLANLFRVNEGGTDALLRDGDIGRLLKFAVRESANLARPAVGTGTSYTSSAAGFAVGTTSIPVITGTGTILAGDVITFAGDTNKYVVATGVAAPGTIVLQEPGLRVALAASAVALTIVAISTRNIILPRSAAVLVARPALQPDGAIAEQMIVTDPLTGLSALLLRSVGDGMTSWYLRIVYDAFVANNYGVNIILGQ
jgi:hypothetical protein